MTVFIGMSYQRIMCPLQEGLPLFWPAKQVAGIAIGPNLPGVSGEALPSFDLETVNFLQTTTKVITTIPLEPPVNDDFSVIGHVSARS